MSERIDSRIFGAIQLLDAATGAPITRPLRPVAPRLTLVHNRRGQYVITNTASPTLAPYRNAFDKPLDITPEDFDLSITDPIGEFLPTTLKLSLPLPDAALFTPIAVTLYSSPSRPLSPNWAAVRVTVTGSQNAPIPGAGLRLTIPTTPPRESIAITNTTGEALLPIAGLPFIFVSEENDKEVLSPSTTANLQLLLHKDGVPVTPDMLRTNDNKLESKGDVDLTISAATSIHHAFQVTP